MDKDRILITGGSGFMGTNLVQYCLDKNEDVLNVDIQRPLMKAHDSAWIECDILDESRTEWIFSDFRPTLVVHLAARTDINEKKSLDGYKVNIQGTENILKGIAKASSVRRAVITSSMLVCRLGYTPTSDEDYQPPNLYGQSKVLTEKITRSFCLPCPWVIIRPTTIWGPWSFRYRDEFFTTLRKRRYFHPGNTAVTKTYGYVGNAIHQIHRLLEAPEEEVRGKTFYIGDPPLDLRTWVDKFSEGLMGKKVRAVPRGILEGLALAGDLFKSMGIPFPFSTFRLKNMITPNILDVEKTMRVTGSSPYSLDDGINLTIEWLNKYREVEAP